MPAPPPTTLANYCRSGYDEKFVGRGGKIEKIEE
jgi:hypothetical protein